MNTNNIIIVILVSILIIMLFRNHITIIKPVIKPVKPVGGCAGTRYGCCPNGVTPRINPLGSNCYKL